MADGSAESPIFSSWAGASAPNRASPNTRTKARATNIPWLLQGQSRAPQRLAWNVRPCNRSTVFSCALGSGWAAMATFLDCRIDGNAILADIEAITRIESPTSDPAGVNRVLDVISGWFDGTGAACERVKVDDRFGEMLRVRCDPGRNDPGILVLSHVDTVH